MAEGCLTCGAVGNDAAPADPAPGRGRHSYRAHVRGRTPPPGLTLREAIVWQIVEQVRMRFDMEAQREAIRELINGATVH